MRDDTARRLKIVGISSMVFFGIYVVTFNLQFSGLQQLQKALVSDALPFVLIAPLHGVRMMAAWFFGWWSIVVLGPSAAYFYVVSSATVTFDVGFHLLVLTYLCSGPLAFSLLRLVLGGAARPMRLEWRYIMLAGGISAVVNAIALGFYLAPDLDGQLMLLWVIGRVIASMLGLMLVLLATLGALRMLKMQLERV
jgi:hypothetical protein